METGLALRLEIIADKENPICLLRFPCDIREVFVRLLPNPLDECDRRAVSAALDTLDSLLGAC